MADPTDLTVQTVTSTAAKLTFTDADTTNANRYKNTGREVLECVNGGSSSATVMVATGATFNGLALGDHTITLAAGERFHGIYQRTDIYNDANGYTVLTAGGDGAADIDYAVYKY